MRMRSDRAGFALPMVLLVIGFVTAGALAAFARAGAEIQIVDHQVAETNAFALAEAGLAHYTARGKITPLDTTFTYARGSARVIATLMRPAQAATDSPIYVIRSTGRVSGGVGRPAGERTVAQFAWRVPTTLQVMASWTSLSGLQKAGAAGNITGFDGCSGAQLPGVAVPNNGFGGHTNSVSGNPPINYMGTQAEMASQIKIDWAGITDPVAPSFTPDFIRCYPGTYAYDSRWSPCTGWPAPSVFTSTWPVVLINGSTDLPTSGRGVLVVTGDLTFGGNENWDGIILVGGKIVDNGAGDIQGTVYTGLNVLKGWGVGESSKANGTKDYVYNSCKIRDATAALARTVPIPRTWVDNWAAW